jgi:hypothetical protein
MSSLTADDPGVRCGKDIKLMRRKALVMAVMLVLIPGTSLFALDTFRCGPAIIVPGDSTARVIINCGEPSYREILNTGQEGPKVENWFYNCGSSGFIYALRFVNGVLQTIGIDGYGSGQSDCRGAPNR